MAQELLVPLRPLVASTLPGSPSKGDTVVLNADGHLYTYNGSAWVDNGAAGAGGETTGRTVVDFGSPGSPNATVVVTGLAAILAASWVVDAWILAEATADHSVDEHHLEALSVRAGNIVDGVGFTIFVDCINGYANGQFSIAWKAGAVS